MVKRILRLRTRFKIFGRPGLSGPFFLDLFFMNCPKCLNSLSPFNFESDLFFDRCDFCKGMWLEKGELAKTMGEKEDFPEPERAKSGPKSSQKCPKCLNVNMIEVALSPKGKLILDTCPQCSGVWLDSKELVKIQKVLRDIRIETKKKKIGSL